MVGAEKFPREIHDDGLALARWEAHIGDPAPAALRVLHLEIGEDDARLPSLGEGQVDARVGREDPPVEKELDTFARQTAQVAEVENQVVERGDALVACEGERLHVAVVPRGQRGQPVGALLVGRGNGRAESRPRNGVQAQLRQPRRRRYEPLVYVQDRKSTRLNSSHGYISYAVFCLKKKKKNKQTLDNTSKHYTKHCAPAAIRDTTL